MFADLHCHPTMYSFNRMRNHPNEDDHAKFNAWQTPRQDLKAMAQGARASGYAQCDIPKLVASKTRLVFASSTPIEKGFFGAEPGDDKHQSFIREALRLVSGATLFKSALNVVRGGTGDAAYELSGILRNQGPLRRVVQQMVMRYDRRRIRHIVSRDYDYWDEFLREYEFLRRCDGETRRADFEHITHGERVREQIEGCYHLVKGPEQLTQIIEGSDSEVALVLTIEGSHVFSIGPNQERVDDDLLFERIRTLKSLDHPVFFITFAHHFDNGLCGHAHSILDSAAMVINQSKRMNAGFERSRGIGMRAARALLGIDDRLEDLGERRILVDAKHMSASARKEYYAELLEPFNARHSDSRRPKLPVLFSHACYAGVATLDELAARATNENDHWHAPPFYAWNINICDEDIRAVHASDGLIGVCFDQRVAGVGPRHKVPDQYQARVLLNHFFAFVDVIMQDDRLNADERRTAWDCVCLGTDYDGFIDPVSRYPTVMALPRFASDLAEALEQVKHTRMIGSIGVDKLVEKICWRNAYDFACTHLPAAG